VLATGSVTQNAYNFDECALAFTGQKYISFPSVGFLDKEEWEKKTTEEIGDALVKVLEEFDSHGYIAEH